MIKINLKKIIVLGVFALVFFGFAGDVSATTYYVDSSITDTNAASATPDFTTYNPATFSTSTGSDSVFKTIADINAFSSLQPGDSVLLRKGQTWNETLNIPASGVSGNVITFGVFGSGDYAILDASGLSYGINILGNSYITLSGNIKVIDATSANIFTSYTGGKISDHITISGLTFDSAVSRNLDLASLTNSTISNITSTNSAYGLLLRGDANGSASNNTVENSTFENNSLTGITILGATTPGDPYVANNNVIDSCTITGNGNGLSADHSSNTIFRNNTVDSNNNASGEKWGIGCTSSSGLIIENNYIYGHTVDGIQLYGDATDSCDGTIIRYNNVVGNSYSGLSFSNYILNTTVDHNLFRGNTYNLSIDGDDSSNYIDNNTFVDGSDVNVRVDVGSVGFYFKNNIAYTSGVSDYNLKFLDNLTSITHLNNSYYGGVVSDIFYGDAHYSYGGIGENRVAHSNDFENSSWYKGSAVSLSSNSITPPFGSDNVTTYISGGSGNTEMRSSYDNIFSPRGNYTFSMYCLSASGSQQLIIGVGTDTDDEGGWYIC